MRRQSCRHAENCVVHIPSELVVLAERLHHGGTVVICSVRQSLEKEWMVLPMASTLLIGMGHEWVLK